MIKLVKILIIVISIEFITITKTDALITIIKVAFESNLPPYQFVEDNRCLGLHIDVLNNIAEKKNIIIEYVPMKNSKDCFVALNSGKVDIVLGAIENKEYESQSTDSISQSSIIMLANNEFAKSINYNNSVIKKAVFENNTIGYSYINKIKNIQYIVVSNQIRAFNMLISGEADLLIGVKNSILYQLEKLNLEDQYTIVNNFMFPIEYTIITKKGDKDLLNLLNNELQNIRINGDYSKILKKWINEENYVYKKFTSMFLTVLLILILIFFIVFIFNARLSFLLKKQVEEKTKELKKINKDLENQIIQTKNYNELKNCIVENSPSGIISIDNKYRITLYNQSACKLTGLDKFPIDESAYDIPLLKCILIKYEDKLFNRLFKIVNKEITLKTEDNNISYRYDIYQLYNFDNSIRGVILSINDITKELKIKEEIFEKEKNKALNQLIAGIAHEIRNPLTSIKTFVQLIPTKINNLNFQNLLFEFVPKEVDRVNDLIQNLIDYAKPKSNRMYKIDLNEIVKKCTILIEPTLCKKNIELIIKQENELMIYGNENELSQIIMNIMLNGIDSMVEKIKTLRLQEKLRMKIYTYRKNDKIYIQFIDEGLGMTGDEIKKSTEPFYTNKINGVGLGLSLTKQYVEENNGVLIIESKPLFYTKVTIIFRRYLSE